MVRKVEYQVAKVAPQLLRHGIALLNGSKQATIGRRVWSDVFDFQSPIELSRLTNAAGRKKISYPHRVFHSHSSSAVSNSYTQEGR